MKTVRKGISTRMTGNPEASPDFRRELSLVLLNESGEEIFRSAPLFSAVEAEAIGRAGVDEFFTMQVVKHQDRGACVVVADLLGNEIFRTPAFLSTQDAEQIKADGVEDHFAVTIAPVDGVKYAGMQWSAESLRWKQVEALELQTA